MFNFITVMSIVCFCTVSLSGSFDLVFFHRDSLSSAKTGTSVEKQKAEVILGLFEKSLNCHGGFVCWVYLFILKKN